MRKHVLFACWMSSLVAVASPAVSYKVTWTSPSMDSIDSMPLSGRLGAGANVWVQDGSIWFYLAHNGAYDAHGRLLKLGALRITPKDAKLGETGFTQTLDPSTGTITITQGSSFKASLWFAGETLVFESENASPQVLEVAYGTWREKTKEGIRNDMMGAKTTYYSDQIQASPSGFLAFHRNAPTMPSTSAASLSRAAASLNSCPTSQPVVFPARPSPSTAA